MTRTIVILALAVTACAAAEKAAATEAETAFREQNRACKRQYADTAQQDACREKVAESWGVTYTPRHDAGKDAQ
jgi:hypothetical protein